MQNDRVESVGCVVASITQVMPVTFMCDLRAQLNSPASHHAFVTLTKLPHPNNAFTFSLLNY
jgi:hypothetical protein